VNQRLILAVAAVALLFGAALNPAEAQQEPKSLSELLRLVEQGRARDSEELRQREREFEQQRSEQERLLREIRQRQSAVEQKSQSLEGQFETNEREIAALNQQLIESLGGLRELFGVVQLVAGDAASQFETSLTSLQYEGRREFMLDLADRMGQTARIASVEELERL
jgi:biopolymer transport protein ExbB